MSVSQKELPSNIQAIMMNRGCPAYPLHDRRIRTEGLPHDLLDYLEPIYFPKTRLLRNNDQVVPFFDRPERFATFPEPINSEGEVLWEMRPFLEKIFPKDEASQMLYRQMELLLYKAAGKFYQNFQKYIDESPDLTLSTLYYL